jgi:hypothetical protein
MSGSGNAWRQRITLCGSTKFKAELETWNLKLKLAGWVVYSCAAFGHADDRNFTDEQKTVLDEVHKRKIDNSDAIVVLNVGGYIGNSTKSELEYAIKHNKAVFWLEGQTPSAESLL